jgi:hypothetical protein
MGSRGDLPALKKRVSAEVLKLPGVSGVGLPARGITVYLADDSAEVRDRVSAKIESLKLAVDVHLEVTGKFGRF